MNKSTYVRQESKMRKLNQTQVAREAGISKSYLSMILSGQRTPNPELAEKLSSLGVVNSEAKFSLRGRCPRPLDECAE
jgi:transcriptional regulator with XRE-family HTH domain